MYQDYLEGMSLRQVAIKYGYGIRYWIVYRMLKAEYGADCCSTDEVSLLRSLIQDHKVPLGDLGDLEGYKGAGRIRSQKTLDNLSRYKTVFDPVRIEKQRAYTVPWDYVSDTVLDFLRLPLYTILVSYILYELSSLKD